MSLDVWSLYVLSIFIVIMIPGSLSLFMVSNSVNHGIIKSYPAFLGGTLASSIFLVISATGLGALITASDKLFLVLKLSGAAYLVYLGLSTLISSLKRKNRDSLPSTPPSIDAQFSSLFKKAFLLGASNPKDIIFFMAFLPQFISSEENLKHQIVVIVATWIVVDLICKILYGLLATVIKPYLNSAKSMRMFDQSTGVLFISAGIASVLLG